MLDAISCVVAKGEKVALLGPNGAGKTTTLAIGVGLRRPDKGVARLFGADPRTPAVRWNVGVTPQDTSFPPTLRVEEVVRLVRDHYPGAPDSARTLSEFGVAEIARRQCGGLSGGERRRLALALAFVPQPQLVVLDEPTTGLDVETRMAAWQTIAAYEGGVLLTTHNLDEAERLSERIIVIDRGRLLAVGSPAELRARAGTRTIRLAPTRLPPLPSGTTASEENGRLRIVTRDVDAVIRALVAAGAQLDTIEVTPATLEDAFLELTRRRET